MPYEDVKAKCFFCKTTIEGNQRYMLAGKTLPTQRGRPPRWLKEKPEHKWIWNGLSVDSLGQRVEFNFYLCPLHQTEDYYKRAFEWAQKEVGGVKCQKSKSLENKL